ncbi:MAG: PA14 domain-containing protein, partial [Chloroflexia bacterium]
MQFTTPATSSVSPPLPSQSARVQLLGNVSRWRWLLGVAALGVALYAEQLVEQARVLNPPAAPPTASWFLFGLAAILFVVGVWPVPRLLPAQSPFLLAGLTSGRKRLFLVLLGLAALSSLIATTLFVALNSVKPEAGTPNWAVNNASWLLYILSLLFFAAAFVVWERSDHPRSERPEYIPGDRLPRRVEWVLMAGLLALALMLRLPDLDNVPPGLWFDEAQNGLVAKQLLAPNAIHLTFISERTEMGALYFYFLGWALELFGSTVWPLRLLPALAGSLIAPMIYLLASRLYGWRTGLAAAGLVAVSSWNITFSRFGIVSMLTVALDVAIYLCIAQAIRTGRLGYYAAGGVLLGLALQGYYISRLVPFVLLAVFVHQLITNRMRLMRAVRVGIVVFLLGAILGFLPVATFAAQNWDAYNSRISEASIFSPNGSDGRPDAFERSLTKHGLMFNWQGDSNGRHNLPGRPMLDWVTAALFFAGLGTCVLRAWRWQYFFPVVWLVAATAGGVLSLLFEAPQSHRTLENSVVTALIAGIFLGEVWQMVSRAFAPPPLRELRITQAQPETTAPVARPARRLFPQRRPQVATTLPVRKHKGSSTTLPVRARPPEPAAISVAATSTVDPVEEERTGNLAHGQEAVSERRYSRRLAVAMIASAVSLLAVIGWVATANTYRYFEVQAKDRSVWKEMYTSETEAGRVTARYGSTHDVYISSVYFKLPPSQYLAPDPSALEWKGMHTLPLEVAPERGIVLVLDPQSAADIARIERIYPNATFELLRAPGLDPTPLVYTVIIPASDVSALFGVHASLYDGAGGEPREEKTLPGVEYNWDGPGVKSGTLRMTSSLKVDKTGEFKFDLESAGGPSDLKGLLVDGYDVSAGTPISLGIGLHSIVVTDTVTTPKGITRVTWAVEAGQFAPIAPAMLYDPRKIEPRGLTGSYRKGQGFDTQPALMRVDPVISFYFQITPLERPYTVEWLGSLYVPETGVYGLSTEQLTSSRLFVDGNEILVNSQQNAMLEARLDLNKGWHDIRLLYSDLQNYSHVYFYWSPPGREMSIIPSAFLRPMMGRYIEPESGPLPTLDESNGNKLSDKRQVAGSPVPTQTPGSQPGVTQPPSVPGTPIEPELVLGDGSTDGLSGPFTAAVDGKGMIYIYTDKDATVHKFDPDGKRLTSWTVEDAGGKPLAEGAALVVKDNSLLVLDAGTSEVVSFDLDGKLLGRALLCACYYPRGFSLSRDGNLWV